MSAPALSSPQPLPPDPGINAGHLARSVSLDDHGVAGDGIRREPWGRRWRRRALTFPALVLIAAVVFAVTPIALIIAGVGDLVKRQPGFWTRFVVAVNVVMASHFVGLGALLGVWVFSGRCLGLGKNLWMGWNRAVEAWWSRGIIRAAMIVYGMRREIEDIDVVAPGPVLVCSRHASVIDTLLPTALLSSRFGLYMRIVIKFELVYDILVDVVSHRMHRAFIKRGGKGIKAQLKSLRRLTDGMDGDDAAVIFPEGTRFSPARKQQILDSLRHQRPEMAQRAAQLKHLLPVRPAGTFAMLDARPDLDVVFMAHTGLEGAVRLEHFVGGVLYQRTLRVKFWRVPRAEIPGDDADRTAWMCNWWQTMDDWIDTHRDRR